MTEINWRDYIMDETFQVQVMVSQRSVRDGKLAELAMATFKEALKGLEFSVGGVSVSVVRVDPCPCPAGIKGSPPSA